MLGVAVIRIRCDRSENESLSRAAVRIAIGHSQQSSKMNGFIVTLAHASQHITVACFRYHRHLTFAAHSAPVSRAHVVIHEVG